MNVRLYDKSGRVVFDNFALNPFEWTEWLVAAVRSTPFIAWRVELQCKRGRGEWGGRPWPTA